MTPSIFSAWSGKQIHAEFDSLESDRSFLSFRRHTPLPFAERASVKGKAESRENYIKIAREILNDPRNHSWKNSKQYRPLIASICINIALATNDAVEHLWNSSKKTGLNQKEYFEFLMNVSKTGRYIGSKTSQLTKKGLKAWVSITGIERYLRNLLIDTELEIFFAPSHRLVNITNSEVVDWGIEESRYAWEMPETVKQSLITINSLAYFCDESWPIDLDSSKTLADVIATYNGLKCLRADFSKDLLTPSAEPYVEQTNKCLSCFNVFSKRSPRINPPRLTLIDQLIPVFSLLDPENFKIPINNLGFDSGGFFIGAIRIKEGVAQITEISSELTDARVSDDDSETIVVNEVQYADITGYHNLLKEIDAVQESLKIHESLLEKSAAPEPDLSQERSEKKVKFRQGLVSRKEKLHQRLQRLALQKEQLELLGDVAENIQTKSSGHSSKKVSFSSHLPVKDVQPFLDSEIELQRSLTNSKKELTEEKQEILILRRQKVSALHGEKNAREAMQNLFKEISIQEVLLNESIENKEKIKIKISSLELEYNQETAKAKKFAAKARDIEVRIKDIIDEENFQKQQKAKQLAALDKEMADLMAAGLLEPKKKSTVWSRIMNNASFNGFTGYYRAIF
ncbi:MAG: hypothetical protein WCJ92_07900 [Alphaproteobacteria bacterium]